ncbi:FAD-dependent oxidoreductase [Massilia forsythiae]|uniref:FAD-dependent oxidoreductase n=1 Tax=Massilia forsythiae TaxID=2728020 RepID=A0A7Z2VZH1_9BURK|nr:FAD-dependent monooxygenase [Massilia forsythiae]QJE02136.1 FAD-dependent oxidoreductase [Massilia forsythiae]
MNDTEVLIAGAGPTGLVLALWLTRLGVTVRIVDKADAPGTTSRALAVHARTLELYRQMDLDRDVVAAGMRNPAVNLWVKGRRRARLDFRDAGRRLTPFPFVLIYPQDRHEALLVERLQQAGVTVERRTELTGFDSDDGSDGGGGRIRARLRGPDGVERTCSAAWLAGCDGAHSTVRHALGAGFAGGTYEQVFYVADVEAAGTAADGEIHLSVEHADFVILLGYSATGQGRLIGALRGRAAAPGPDATAPDFDDVRRAGIASLGLDIRRVNWFSSYRVHHRVTDRYRSGRAFLLGDAAHVHSPAGGQGMNTGIGDAVNLAWKLAAVLRGHATEALLDSYEQERIAFARKLVETTDRAFSFMTAQGMLAEFVRTRIAPPLASAAYGVKPLREKMFRMLSQTALHYRDSPLSEGMAGEVRAGERLPWIGHDGPDNHAPLAAIAWQAHVYGDPAPDLQAWCRQAGLALHRYDWSQACYDAGLARDATYLVRPDGYTALCDPAGAPARLERWFGSRAMTPRVG